MKKRTHLTSILALTLAVALGGLAELGMLDGAFAQGPQAGSRDAEPSTAKSSAPADEPSRASDYDLKLAETLKTRAGDWRVGPIVYQVMVDRFAPSSNLDAKRSLYGSPKKLREWSDLPEGGRELKDFGLWTHEPEFWGGDLPSLQSKLDYIAKLDVDVLYLNPIHEAFTNHKYDPMDFTKVSPEFGTQDDLRKLTKTCHSNKIRLMLDGVFNHMGAQSPTFKAALDPKNPLRSWFIFDESFGKPGYRRWANVGNLPELNLEHSDVQKHLWAGEDSIVKRYLKDGKDGDGNGGDGIDGWRLDAVQEIGFNHLRAITAAAHDAKKDACVVGEIWNYPEEWARCLDGVINFYLRGIVFELVEGKSSGQLAGRNIERMINDTGIDPLLKSWIVLDNHDTPRIKRQFPDDQLRRIAQVLQFTLPGSPVIYYGAELGMMSGNDDPTQRAPMRWDLVNDRNSDLAWMKKLIQLRKESSALRIGDFRLLDTKELLAFSRRTDHVAENVIVVVNPTALPVHEVIGTRESKLMSGGVLRDEINRSVTTRIDSGRLAVDVPAKTARVFKPVMPDAGRKYSPYKRVQ